jgi:hypothetical protein
VKQSKRNLRNAAARAEKRKEHPPALSKYAAKRRKQGEYSEPEPTHTGRWPVRGRRHDG